ncbi:FG-GAP repeat domain-containing protein, partial [bacterium]
MFFRFNQSLISFLLILIIGMYQWVLADGESDSDISTGTSNEAAGVWEPLGGGVNGEVNAIACSRNNVYVGGRFSYAGNVPANNIAKWNGESWSSLGDVNMTGWIRDIAISNNLVYVGGDFEIVCDDDTRIACLAVWDGNQWSSSGINGSVGAIAVSGNDVYVGGLFYQIGGIYARNIAKWNGSSWSALGSGITLVTDDDTGAHYAYLTDINVCGSNAYVCGIFNRAGGVPAYYIAKWNGSVWSAIPHNIFMDPITIGCSGDNVYIHGGGTWGSSTQTIVENIYKWDGGNWSALGSGVNNRVNAIAVEGNHVYVGGAFTEAGGEEANYITRWDGNNWHALDSGLNNTVNIITLNGGDVYAGGTFTQAGDVYCSRVAVYRTASQYEGLINVASDAKLFNKGYSQGCAWGDYDHDGDPDLFVANMNGENNDLYNNQGDGTFDKITVGDIVTLGSSSSGACWGDYDNDGDEDLFVANTNGENNFLYRNEGDGTFFRVLGGIVPDDGGNSWGCAWGDYDNDGWLDLFVANRNENNTLYHNTGNIYFTKVTEGPVVTDGGVSTSGHWCDYDLDGDLDLFVANTGWNANFLYDNNGDGTFTKVTSGPVVEDAAESSGGSWGDYNNDGYPDLYVPNQ